MSASYLPSVTLSLDQVEAQSRRLVSRQPGSSNDADRAFVVLLFSFNNGLNSCIQKLSTCPGARRCIALSDSIAHLNTSTTFSPLQPLQDTDVTGFLRHAHEQTLISTIEEGRRETQDEFYKMLQDRAERDWEAKKKRVFEELGGRVSVDNNRAVADFKKSMHGKLASSLSAVSTPSLNLQMQNRMMAYDRAVTDLNAARLRKVSFPIVHTFMHVAASLNTPQILQTFHILSKITSEPPAVPVGMINPPILERRFAKQYLGNQDDKDATALRKQIAKGAREALEEQYWDVMDRTIQSRPTEAMLGGDPSVENKVRAFLFVRYYRNGEWEERIQIIAGQPIWARLFYLVRTGYTEEALGEAIRYQDAINHNEKGFVTFFRAWVESPERRVTRQHRTELQSIYNQHMLNAATADPFKLALYKLMGRLDPGRRSVPHVTTTTEDWLWFQLAMLDEEEEGGLRAFGEVLLGYGERQFDGAPNQPGSRKGVWASVLLMSGQFERAVAALWENPETEIEAVHLAIALAYHGLLNVPSKAETSKMTPCMYVSVSLPPRRRPALSMSMMIWRYIRQFVKMDAKEALQYVYCVTLPSDQPDLIRRILVLSNSGPAWEELVGGFRADGTKFDGVIERSLELLKLNEISDYHQRILMRAAEASVENDRIPEAIKLYNLAGDYTTVMSCLATALGGTVSKPTPDEKSRAIEATASEIVHNYKGRNQAATGTDRDAVMCLLEIRRAMDEKLAGRPDSALTTMEQTSLIPLDGDVGRITKQAEAFKGLHESLQRNLPTYITLTMDALAAVHQQKKNAMMPESSRQAALNQIRKQSRSLMIFAGILKYRMSPDVYSYLARLDVEIAL
ncbi:nucleoporin-interacting protein NIC96 [Hymenopellis radicata]|nr:nucleoporin-interacting protein NIC96 [Hymenopellis radicata]